jgi:hypothetical protein
MTQRIMLSRLVDLEHKEELAAIIAGIKEN